MRKALMVIAALLAVIFFSSCDLFSIGGPLVPGGDGLITVVRNDSGSLTLSWGRVRDYSDLTYRVYYSESPLADDIAIVKANAVQLGSGKDINSYVINGLSANATYYFFLIVANTAGAEILYETAEFTIAETDSGSDAGTSLEPYYSDAEGLTGAALKTALNDIIDGHRAISYSTVWTALKAIDEDPANPDNVILMYTGRSQSKDSHGGLVDEWNREHTWAKSHGDFGTSMGPGTDLHHLRPTDVSVNSARGNRDFDNGGSFHSEAEECRYDSDSWEPRDEVKGDVARMLFYMDVRYDGTEYPYGDLVLVDAVPSSPEAGEHGKLSVLKQWHLLDPVDDYERNRNELIYSDWQGNRNPFIDHPEWVEEIW